MARPSQKTPEVSFSCNEADRRAARSIAKRARSILLKYGVDREALDIEMDVVATHCNGNPMNLKRLLKADDFNLLHDISGIYRHLDRDTGKLGGCFLPRFSA